MASLDGKIALVTGASRGIGRAVAIALAKEGCHVIALARNIKGLERLDDEIQRDGGRVTLVACDLTDFIKIDELGSQIHKRFGKLDILVSCAAILGGLSPICHISPASWQKVMDLNLTSNYRLLRSLDVLLRQSETPKVMFAMSEVGIQPQAFWGGYAIAKAGLAAMAKIYQEESKSQNMIVKLILPGAVKTKLRAEAYPGEDEHRLMEANDREVVGLFVDVALGLRDKEGIYIKGRAEQFEEA